MGSSEAGVASLFAEVVAGSFHKDIHANGFFTSKREFFFANRGYPRASLFLLIIAVSHRT
jgi:hypothetical protein